MVAVVTTDRKCHKESLELAAEMAKRLGLQQVPRQKESVAELMENADFLIQATSVGLKPDDPPALAEKFFHPGMKVKIFDTIYHPTGLQKIAEKMGISFANGKEMLIRQGAASFEQWTGVKPDLDAMRRGFDEGVPGK